MLLVKCHFNKENCCSSEWNDCNLSSFINGAWKKSARELYQSSGSEEGEICWWMKWKLLVSDNASCLKIKKAFLASLSAQRSTGIAPSLILNCLMMRFFGSTRGKKLSDSTLKTQNKKNWKGNFLRNGKKKVAGAAVVLKNISSEVEIIWKSSRNYCTS